MNNRDKTYKQVLAELKEKMKQEELAKQAAKEKQK